MISRFVGRSRYLILVAVVCLFAATIGLLTYSTIRTFQIISSAFAAGVSSSGAKTLALSFIELTDYLLLSTVLYITAAGLYELFIDDNLPLLPNWLVIRDLNDLKNKLVGVVILVLGVSFLGQIISWDGQRNLLGYGAAIALVIAALTYFLAQKPKKFIDAAVASGEGTTSTSTK